MFYDPQVARTFVKCVAVPLLGQSELEGVHRRGLRADGHVVEASLEMFEEHGLCYDVLSTSPCPLDSQGSSACPAPS